MKDLDCAAAQERDLVSLYLGRRLPEAEAESFEAHYFACQNCWAEVQAGAEIRAARGVPILAARTEARSKSGTDVWTLLAAAAAIVVIVTGLQQLGMRTELATSPTVWRGSAMDGLTLEVATGASGQVLLRWNAHPEAQAYRVEVFRPDGATAWEGETSETAVKLEAGMLPLSKPGISFFATVEALDGTRQPVARSQRIRLPRP